MLQWIRILWEYNYWAHRKLWDCLMTISDEDFRKSVDYSVGSVQDQIIHVLIAEALWLSRIQAEPMRWFSAAEYPTRDLTRAKWDEVESSWRDYIEILTDDELNRQVNITTTEGEQYVHSVAEIMTHVVNHGTDHRAQILELLYSYGGQTVEQDLIFYLREQQSS